MVELFGHKSRKERCRRGITDKVNVMIVVKEDMQRAAGETKEKQKSNYPYSSAYPEPGHECSILSREALTSLSSLPRGIRMTVIPNIWSTPFGPPS